jgi:uncharacterized protein (DUF2267 family)
MQLVKRTEEYLGKSDPGATESAILSTLATLGEILSGGEASRLAARLPEELRSPLEEAKGDPKPLSLEEFYGRVAEREGVGGSTAQNYASAVMHAIGENLDEAEAEDLRSQLPRQFHDFLTQG